MLSLLSAGVLYADSPPASSPRMGKDGMPFYEMNLVLDPITGRIQVKGSLVVPQSVLTEKRLAIYLHKDLKFCSLKQNGQEIDTGASLPSDIRYMPEALLYYLPLVDDGKHASQAEFSFSYEGRISSLPQWLANMLSETWTEIGLYTPWFPINPELKLFHYRLNLKVNPGFRAFAMGREKRIGDGFSFETVYPTSDIVVCVSRRLKIEEQNVSGKEFRLVHQSLDAKTVTALLSDV